MKTRFRSDEFQNWLAAELSQSDFADKVYLVGGCVRDRELGLDTRDLDLVIEEEGGARRFCEWLSAKAGAAASAPHHLGAGYPIWQLTFRSDPVTGDKHWPLAGVEVQIADTQREMFPDPHSRQRVAHFGTLEEDCRRRDFTVNMLYRSLTSGEILDPSGRGLGDLRAGILRGHPQVSMEKIFSDDPLRMLRLFRFQVRFAWTIDLSVLAALRSCRERLRILSVERIRDEWTRTLRMGRQAPWLRLLQENGILEILFPELLAMIACEQDTIYHAEGDVWVHTLKVIELAPPTLRLQLAALLHDIGKPATQSFVGERIKFLEHEKVSSQMTIDFLRRWKFSEKIIREVTTLVALHLRGADAQKWASLRPARKLLREAGELIDDLLLLIEADSRASLGRDGTPRLEHLAVLRQKMAEAQALPPRAKALLNGQEIMALLQLSPGPLVKEAQTLLLEAEDAAVAEGREWNSEIAACYLKANWRH